MSETGSSAGRRLRIITIDQAIAGASNVLIAVLAAHLLGVASFGLFGIVFLVYVMAQGVSRALIGDPLLVHPEEARDRRGEVIGTGCLLGLCLAALIAATGAAVALVDGQLGGALVVLAACLPLLVIQDLGRYLGFAMQRPGDAVMLDVTWLLLLLGAVGVLFATDTRTLAWFIAAWGVTGALSGLLVFVQHRSSGLHVSLTWLRFTWGFSWRYLISYVSTQGAALGVLSGVGAIAGKRALGGLQGAVLLVRPFMTFQAASIAAAIGEITRAPSGSGHVHGHAARTSVLATAIAAANALVILLLPDSLGEAVLGDAWDAAEPLLLPVGVQIVFLGVMTGARAGLLGVRGIRKAMVIDVISTVMVLGATISGAAIDGVEGALWAVAFVHGLTSIVWWMVFLARERGRESAPGATAPAPARTVET
jgi:O-antigen/teichoic acid export membrane protein